MRKLKSLLIKLFIASFAIYIVYSFLNKNSTDKSEHVSLKKKDVEIQKRIDPEMHYEDNNKQQINIPIIDQKVTFI